MCNGRLITKNNLLQPTINREIIYTRDKAVGARSANT